MIWNNFLIDKAYIYNLKTMKLLTQISLANKGDYYFNGHSLIRSVYAADRVTHFVYNYDY